MLTVLRYSDRDNVTFYKCSMLKRTQLVLKVTIKCCIFPLDTCVHSIIHNSSEDDDDDGCNNRNERGEFQVHME